MCLYARQRQALLLPKTKIRLNAVSVWTRLNFMTRKSIASLKAEHDIYRKYHNKTFTHTKSGEEYQFLFTCFDEATNEIQAVYCLCAMTWLKFTRPIGEFLEKFEEGHSVK